jgi:hypothetical protein
MLWIRIRKDPKLFARCGTRGYGSGPETGLEHYQKSSKKKKKNTGTGLQFDNYHIKKHINLTFLIKVPTVRYHGNVCLKCHGKIFKIVDIVIE